MIENRSIIKIFIPFIHKRISQKYIEHIFRLNNFGEILNIECFEKKVRKNNKLVYLNHNYAFIDIYIFSTIAGINLKRNIENKFTTYIWFDENGDLGQWEVKPYLTIEDRAKRGFDIFYRKSFYDEEIEKQNLLNDYLEIEKEINHLHETNNSKYNQ